jgi:flagellar M-ring protein FliF
MLQTFRTAAPARQLLLIGIAALTLCAVLAAGWFFFIRTSYDLLYRDLAQTDASTIVAELDRTHVPYRLADGGRTIMVPASAVDSTRLHVAGQDLPLQGTVGFELFNSSSIGLTEFAQRINLQRALQGELARTIMRIDGVEAARVHLSLGEQTAFRGDRRPPRASIAIRTRPGRRLNNTTVRGIQRLVAGSVPDLDLASIAVLNDRGAVVSGEAPEDMAALPRTEEERNVARFFEARIRRAVEVRYPADAIDVTVWAAVGANAEQPSAAPLPVGEGLAAGRDFRLRATVAIASPMTGAAREQVTQWVQSAIGYDPGLGDDVTVTASAPIPAADDWGESLSEPGAATNALGAPESAAEPSMLGSLWTPLALALLIGVVVVLLRRRGRGRAQLGEQERLAYVANLKALLAQRDPDVAPPV